MKKLIWCANQANIYYESKSKSRYWDERKLHIRRKEKIFYSHQWKCNARNDKIKFLTWYDMQTGGTGIKETLEILIRVKYKSIFLDFYYTENMVLKQALYYA